VLSTARALTYAVQFIGAIVLVRILAPEEYGQYQEFIVYSMLAVSSIEFAIHNNLTYFVAKDPSRERQYLSNTTILNLVLCVVGITVIHIARDYLSGMMTFDFVNLMIFYIVAYVNLNYLEFYWVAKGNTTAILYYSVALTVARITTVLVVAYLTRSVLAIIYAVIALQACKCLFVASYLLSRRLLSRKIDLTIMKSQLYFVLPLGTAAVILYFNNDISKVIVSSQLGAVALAMYSVGSREVPVAGIIRASVSTVIFPDIVRKNVEDPALGLHLWKRANVAYTFLMIPLFYTLFYYADVIIITLFTEEYAQAIPIFRIYLLLLLVRDTIETGSPLRALNQNKFFIYGNLLSLAVNIVSLYFLFKIFGLLGPAIALVATIVALQIFLSARIIKSYRVGWRDLFMWKKHFIILAVGLGCLPIVLLGDVIHASSLWGAAVFSALYCVAYLVVLRYCRIEEIDTIMSRIMTKLRLAW